ncbi:MAG: CoA pyrophosphatase [Gammaproteobacteria bacterium PRO9]|nr:CoA pyrophosphatase [Gammaproteobacteria bacterium PRO9]
MVEGAIAALVRSLGHTQPPGNLPEAALRSLPPEARSRLFSASLVPAGVLLALAERAHGWELLLTQRADNLRDHPGQISLPGGRVEAGDAGPREAALREAREEVGLEPGFVRVIGFLKPQAVVTGFAVCPVVALLQPGFSLRIDHVEVADAFWLPLDFLTAPGRLKPGQRTVRGVTVPTLSCQYGKYDIWGATAHILQSLCDQIREATT